MRHQYRYKSIIIPKIGDKYIVVRDAKYGELTFVTGGCKLRESNIDCALRELAEETRESVSVPSLGRPNFTFESRDRSRAELQADKAQGVFVTMVYNVFIVPIDASFEHIKRLYNSKNFVNERYRETSGIYLMSLDELMRSPSTWKFMKDQVLPRMIPRKKSRNESSQETPRKRTMNRW